MSDPQRAADRTDHLQIVAARVGTALAAEAGHNAVDLKKHDRWRTGPNGRGQALQHHSLGGHTPFH